MIASISAGIVTPPATLPLRGHPFDLELLSTLFSVLLLQVTAARGPRRKRGLIRRACRKMREVMSICTIWRGALQRRAVVSVLQELVRGVVL